MANFFDQFDQTAPAAPAGKNFFDQFDPPPAEPVSANNVARSAATGVMIGGGLLNKLDAATNAFFAPAIEPFMKKGPDSINDEPGNTWEERFGNRYRKSLDIQENMDKKFAADHPVLDTVVKIGGGVAATIPLAGTTTGAKILGLTGETLPLQIRNGVLSGSVLGGTDAAVRGEDWKTGTIEGGALGGVVPAVAHGVGKVASSVMNGIRPEPVIPQNTVRVGSTDIPLTESQVTGNPATSSEEQILLRGGRGEPAQEKAQGFKDLQDTRANEARDAIGSSLDTTGAGAQTAPQDAAEKIAAELVAQEQARQAGDAASAAQVGQEGGNLARSLGGGELRAASPGDAAESLSEGLARARDTAKADYRGKYADVAAQPGEFEPGSAAGFRGDVENGLRSADNPVSLDATNTPKSLNALNVIDRHLNLAGPGAPKAVEAAADLGSQHAQNIADIRARFGDDVAAAYDRQKAATVPISSRPTSARAPVDDGFVPTPKPKYEPRPANIEALKQTRDTALQNAQDREFAANSDGRDVFMTPEDRQFNKESAANYRRMAAQFDRQIAEAEGRSAAPAAGAAPAAPKAQSLLEFLASKGGLGPDAELDAIGAHGHTVNVEGMGRRKLVKQGGLPLDYAREAAEEAGYFRGAGHSTSTPTDLLDAIDAEMRGQKRYPEGSEGHENKRAGVARSEREQAEYDRHAQGFEDDLHEAGHGDLGPDVKARAVHLMANEGMHPDEAVEHAMHQLDQEDAAGSAFPGDRPASQGATAAKTGQSGASGFTLRDVEQVRKQLSTLYGDARRAMMGGGSGADVHGMEHIIDQFDDRVSQMVKDGKFSGDGPAVLKMQKDARASFADYKQKFSKRGSGDTVGAAVEKILGKFSDTKATPDTIVNLAYGSGSAPGGQMPVQIAQRIAKIFGKDSSEFATYKQGLFAHLKAGEPEKAADRIDEFLNGTKGKLLSHTVFDPAERTRLAQYADRLRGIAPKTPEPGAAAAAIRRYTGADGSPPASPGKIINDLLGSSGKGNGVNAPLIAQALKKKLSPEGWDQLRQMAFTRLTDAGDGKIPFEAQALSQRLHEFLNESGSQLSKALFSDKERGLMRQMGVAYKQMIPVKGTTNPSGTAPMLAKIANGARHTLLPLLGFTHGGVPGAAVAYGMDKALNALGNAKAARNATKLFYGKQPDKFASLPTAIARKASAAARGLTPELTD
jgi:hypothetical protein